MRPEEPTNKKQRLAVLPRSSAMRLVLEDPSRHWSSIPEVYKNDKDFVAEFIRKAKTLPSKNLFERTLPQEIRMSKQVALAFLSRDDFVQLYNDRQLFCPHNLANDKEVVMKYCQKIPRALQTADLEMCDDYDIVSAAVSRAGFEIQYASVRLQANEEIIRMACQQCGQALLVCTPSQTLQRLLSDRDFLLMAFRSGGGAAMRLVVDKDLLSDEELWLEAVTNGMVIRYVPPSISSTNFWHTVVRVKSSLYHDLRQEFRDNPSVARAAIYAPDLTPTLFDRLYKTHPNVFDGSREVALAVVRMGDYAKTYLQNHREHYQDAEIMLMAVQNNASLYFDLGEPLSLSMPIVKAALTDSTAHRVLVRLGQEWLQNQEELCIAAIKVSSSLTEAANAIPDEMWRTSRALALSWLKRGCRVLQIFESRLENDRELALTVAEFVHRDYEKIGRQFRDDKSFVIDAVRLNGRNIKHVSDPSMELMVSATGTYAAAATNRPDLAAHVDEKLALSEMFRKDFLRGFCVPTSTLFHLNVDSETSTAYKIVVAQFLGVPIGKTLTLYQHCQTKLQQTNAPGQGLAVRTEPIDLPLNFFTLRVSLRGGNARGDVGRRDHRLAQMLFDDGMPFGMLRRDQQRMAMLQNRLDVNLDREAAVDAREERFVRLRQRLRRDRRERLELRPFLRVPQEAIRPPLHMEDEILELPFDDDDLDMIDFQELLHPPNAAP